MDARRTFEAFKALHQGHKAAPVDLEPTSGQRNSEGYPLVARIRFQGLPEIHVEQRKGEVRSGPGWTVRMPYHYGEIAGTEGVDGDPVDVCVGPDAHAPFAYVVHQKAPGHSEAESYDEDKVMVGFPTKVEALAAYRKAYTRPGFLGSVTRMSVGQLQAWLESAANRGRKITVTDGRGVASPPLEKEEEEGAKALRPAWLKADARGDLSVMDEGETCEDCSDNPCACDHVAEEGAKALDDYRIPEHLRWVTAL